MCQVLWRKWTGWCDEEQFGEGEVLWRANLKLHIMEIWRWHESNLGEEQGGELYMQRQMQRCRGKCRDAEAGEWLTSPGWCLWIEVNTRGEGGSDGKPSVYNAGDPGSSPGLGRSPGEGNGNPLQYYYLENPMDRGAWQAAVYGVAKSRTWLTSLHFTSILTGSRDWLKILVISMPMNW